MITLTISEQKGTIKGMNKFDLFNPIIVAVDKLHPQFVMLKDSKGHIAARQLMNETYNRIPNPDNNFIEQFQSQGFNSRVFELALFPLLEETGFKIEMNFEAPDFMLTGQNRKFAVEATASNPQRENLGKNTLADIKEMTEDEATNKAENDFPIRAGSSLLTKINKDYWGLPHCKDIPIIFAYQALHEGGSLFYTPTDLAEYLFGVRLSIEDGVGHAAENVKGHTSGRKQIPSGFFNQPNTEKLSAVLFTNGMTVPKFVRMARDLPVKNQHPWGRRGMAYFPDPDHLVIAGYQYLSTEELAHEEDWSQGAMLIHNPNAIHKIEYSLFPNFGHIFMNNGAITIDVPKFHPITSEMLIFGSNET